MENGTWFKVKVIVNWNQSFQYMYNKSFDKFYLEVEPEDMVVETHDEGMKIKKDYGDYSSGHSHVQTNIERMEIKTSSGDYSHDSHEYCPIVLNCNVASNARIKPGSCQFT